MTSHGLYVHIPFCKSKCIYCDFYSVASSKSIERVIDGLIREWESRSSELDYEPETIYIGGGTPSILTLPDLRKLLSALPVSAATEITFEANPDDITPKLVDTLTAYGVNRLSLGVQSLDDKLLRWMRRRHNSSGALNAIETARKGNLYNISADLIYGLPGMSDNVWYDTVTRLLDTGIKHLSAYCLTYSEGTPLTRSLENGDFQEVDEDSLAEQFRILRQLTHNAGFEHYEISNFAVPGFRSRHNSAYWRMDSKWLGIGPAAHSFDGMRRRANPADIRSWLNLNGSAPEAELESQLDLLNDHIVAALRTVEGIDLNHIPKKYHAALLKSAQPHISAGHLILNGSHLAIKPSSWLISNIFMRDLILV